MIKLIAKIRSSGKKDNGFGLEEWKNVNALSPVNFGFIDKMDDFMDK